MAVLSHQSIRARCSGSVPLIDPYDERLSKSASYDLTLGSEYVIGNDPGTQFGSIEVRHLERGRQTLEIPPNHVVVIVACEKVSLSDDLVGHLSLKMDVLLLGLVMANQGQLDAGYKGPVYALLYNLSHRAVSLQLGQKILRLEFSTLDEPTEKPYAGDYKEDFGLGNVVKSRINSGLHVLHENVRQLRTFGFIGAASLVLAVLGFIFGLVGPWREDVAEAGATARLTERLTERLSEERTSDQAEIDRLNAKMRSLQRQLRAERNARR